MNRRAYSKKSRMICYSNVMISLLVALLDRTLSFMVVPAPRADYAKEVSGTVNSIRQPYHESSDLTIILDDGQSYYINRASGTDNLVWEQRLAQVEPGS